MIKTFTQDDLIRYVYHETTPQENQAIEQALIVDNQLLNEYHETLAVARKLNTLKKEPSQKSVDNILNYSKSLNSHSLG